MAADPECRLEKEERVFSSEAVKAGPEEEGG